MQGCSGSGDLFVCWSFKTFFNSNMFSHCLCPYCRFYWVVIPGVLESGQLNKMSVSLIKPNETLHVTVTLTSEEQNITIHTETATSADIHSSIEFLVNCQRTKTNHTMLDKSRKSTPNNFLLNKMLQVPSVEEQQVRNLEVVVRGENFYSKEVRKVMIKVYKPLTFVQTDKPIYLPGQKGKSGLIANNCQQSCIISNTFNYSFFYNCCGRNATFC